MAESNKPKKDKAPPRPFHELARRRVDLAYFGILSVGARLAKKHAAADDALRALADAREKLNAVLDVLGPLEAADKEDRERKALERAARKAQEGQAQTSRRN